MFENCYFLRNTFDKLAIACDEIKNTSDTGLINSIDKTDMFYWHPFDSKHVYIFVNNHCY